MEFLLDVHCHSLASGHAYSTVMECVESALAKGLRCIAITDHAPAMEGAPTMMHFYNLKAISRTIKGVEVLSGVELNILDSDGGIDMKKGALKNLDVVIASMHPPCYAASTMENHTRAVIQIMQNPYVNIIGHLGDPRYPIDVQAVLQVAQETDTIIEINNLSLNPKGARFGGEQVILELVEGCKQMGMPVLMGSDAHFCEEIGDFEFAVSLMEKVAMPEELILNTSVERFKMAWQKKKSKLRE